MADHNSAEPPQSSSQDTEWSLARRLRSRKFIGEDAVAAIHGRRLPLHLGRPLVRHCVVRGLRHHFDFATGDGAILKGLLPMFTTAINARLIMSNQVPEMNSAEEMPYCIWYPDLPSEETLRQLNARYPDMRYHVGRTCAVAGYTELYKSLDILPEAAIAEEARASGSQEIFELIIKEPIKWKVFNDYTGTLSVPTPSCLNGDTTVCGELKHIQGFRRPHGRVEGEEGDDEPDDGDEDDLWHYDFSGYKALKHNVTGDHGLDAPDSWADMLGFLCDLPTPRRSTRVSQTALDLLSNPLPADLTTCEKNVLIVMAAYRGDIDRYCRLRRPHFVYSEFEAIIRGIYHNTQFAKWWSTQPPLGGYHGRYIATAIFARFIMNDDISWAAKVLKDDSAEWSPFHPELIYYPDIAYPTTYEALARALPHIRPAVARAAVYADYKDLFDLVVTGPNDEFDTVTPNHHLYVEALQSAEPYYRETIERIAREKGIFDTIRRPAPGVPDWKEVSLQDSIKHGSTGLDLYPDIPWIDSNREGWKDCLYDGICCNAISLERYISLPREWRPTQEDVEPLRPDGVWLDYETWPPNISELLSSTAKRLPIRKQ